MTKTGPERQDESGNSPLALCHNGRVLAIAVPAADYPMLDDPAIRAQAERLAAQHGLRWDDLELLAICHLHPQSSAVDCLDCEPA